MSGITGGGGGSGALVSQTVLPTNKNMPEQTAIAACSGTLASISVGACNLCTLTTSSSIPEAVVDKLLYISAATNVNNRGFFFIVDRPTTTSVRYYNGQAVAESGAASWNISSYVTGIPSGYNVFCPYARHTITIKKTTDIVLVHAEMITHHIALNTEGPCVKIDGVYYCLNGTDFFRSFNANDKGYMVLHTTLYGLSVGTHVVATGTYLDYSRYVLYAGLIQTNMDYTVPNFHGWGNSISEVTVVSGNTAG